MTRRESRTVIIFWLTAILLVAGGLAASAWTVEDCVEVNWDHPDCDQYPTTTVYVTTTQPEVTTTTAEVTTTTEGNGTTTTVAETTTTTPNETTTTQPPFETTTTTIPFDSVPDTIPTEIGTPTVESTLAPPLEELPETGINSTHLALLASLFLLAGVGVLALDRREG